MKIYDTYGFQLDHLLKAKEVFEEISGISLESHYSSYKGVYYSNFTSGKNEKYEIRNNYFDGEGWSEEEYKDYNIILYISCSPNTNEIKEKILKQNQIKVSLLERTIITQDRWRMIYKYVAEREILVSKEKLPPIL